MMKAVLIWGLVVLTFAVVLSRHSRYEKSPRR
jgi:hypothetical protein